MTKLYPALDAFENSTVFLSTRSKITGRALESIKDLEHRSWSVLREKLINNFSDKSNSITILNSILNIKGIKMSLFFETTKGKFNNFQSRLFIENDNLENRKAITEFVEKLVITHFITNLNNPSRNNLATRNPKSVIELETLVKNDLQYLRSDQSNKPILNTNNQHAFRPSPNKTTNRTNFGQIGPPNKPMFGNSSNYNNCNYNNNRTLNLSNPDPMSVQTRQTRPWQRESFNNNNEQQSSSQEPKIQNNSETVQNSFLEFSRI